MFRCWSICYVFQNFGRPLRRFLLSLSPLNTQSLYYKYSSFLVPVVRGENTELMSPPEQNLKSSRLTSDLCCFGPAHTRAQFVFWFAQEATMYYSYSNLYVEGRELGGEGACLALSCSKVCRSTANRSIWC